MIGSSVSKDMGGYGFGAAVLIASFTASSCRFINHRSNYGGAVSVRMASSELTLYGSYFSDNNNSDRADDIANDDYATVNVHCCGNGYYGDSKGRAIDYYSSPYPFPSLFPFLPSFLVSFICFKDSTYITFDTFLLLFNPPCQAP